MLSKPTTKILVRHLVKNQFVLSPQNWYQKKTKKKRRKSKKMKRTRKKKTKAKKRKKNKMKMTDQIAQNLVTKGKAPKKFLKMRDKTMVKKFI